MDSNTQPPEIVRGNNDGVPKRWKKLLVAEDEGPAALLSNGFFKAYRSQGVLEFETPSRDWAVELKYRSIPDAKSHGKSEWKLDLNGKVFEVQVASSIRVYEQRRRSGRGFHIKRHAVCPGCQRKTEDLVLVSGKTDFQCHECCGVSVDDWKSRQKFHERYEPQKSDGNGRRKVGAA